LIVLFSLTNEKQIADDYINKTDTLTATLLQHFSTPSSFRYNQKYIKRIMLEGLTQECQDVLESNHLMGLGSLRSRDEENIWKKRIKAFQRINRLFNKLGVEIYGEAFKTSLPSASKTSAKSATQKTPDDSPSTISSLSGTRTSSRKNSVIKAFDDEAKEAGKDDDVDDVDVDDKVAQKPRVKYVNRKGHKATPQGIFYFIHILLL
jgi:hypothetical protein